MLEKEKEITVQLDEKHKLQEEVKKNSKDCLFYKIKSEVAEQEKKEYQMMQARVEQLEKECSSKDSIIDSLQKNTSELQTENDGLKEQLLEMSWMGMCFYLSANFE